MDFRKVFIILIVVGVLIGIVFLYYKYFTLREEWVLEIYVGDKKYASYSLSQLESMSSPIKTPDDRVVPAVPLKDLIKNIDLKHISKITPYGADGYHRDIPGHLATSSYILILKDDPKSGPLRFMVTELSRKYWVKALVKIVLEVGG